MEFILQQLIIHDYLSGQVGGHGAAQANETNKYPSFDQNSWTQQAGHDKRRSDAGHDN